jgi:hypothetical protein
MNPPFAAVSNNDKLAQFEEWKKFLSIREPELDVLADEIYDRIMGRRSPITHRRMNQAFPHAMEVDVKEILLQLHKKTPLFLAEPLPTILSAGSSLQDDNLLYYGVYVGGFVNGKTGISIREAIRIANVCIDRGRLHRVIKPVKAGPNLPMAASMMAKCWKKTLEEEDMWVEVKEFPHIHGESEVMASDIPKELEDVKYDAEFPFTPLYVGYSTDPKSRWKAHARGNLHVANC